MKEKYNSIILFGPPGVGKGTQGNLLGALETYYHFSTGDMLRDLDINTDIGKQVKDLLDQGEFAPDDLMFKLLDETLERYVIGGEI